MGPKRSLRSLASASGTSQPVLTRWSVRHGWLARLEEHSRHLARVAAEAAEADPVFTPPRIRVESGMPGHALVLRIVVAIVGYASRK